MSADSFFHKRIISVVSCMLAVAVVGSVLGYAFFLNAAKIVTLAKSFYFLVSPSTHIEASTHIAAQNGGAGYLLEWEGREYVALSVYMTEADGAAVQVALFKEGENTLLLPVFVDKVYLKTIKQKQNIEKIRGAFVSLYSCIKVLDCEIERLVGGATQESSKDILRLLGMQLRFLREEYELLLPKFSKICQNSERQLFSMIENIVYARDLRYLLCELCAAYADIARGFTL